MKKILSILFLSLFSFVVNAQQTIPDTTISNAERIIDKYSGKIANTFIAGIEKITPVAINGFELAVRLQIAIGLFDLVGCVLFFICFIQLFKEYNRINALIDSKDCPTRMNNNSGPFDDKNATFKLGAFTILSILSVILLPFFLYEAFTHLIAPEWFAIKEIIELFK